MKNLILSLVGIISMITFNSCTETDALVDVSVQFSFLESGELYALPIINKNDNCKKHSFVYYIDENKIGSSSSSPFDIKHALTEDEKTVGTHTITVEIKGTNGSSLTVSTSVTTHTWAQYIVYENGEIKLVTGYKPVTD
jgi:hypothetical protein